MGPGASVVTQRSQTWSFHTNVAGVVFALQTHLLLNVMLGLPPAVKFTFPL